MTITVHTPNGYSATFRECEVLSKELGWLRFKGLNEFDKPVVMTTNMHVEIKET